MATMRDSVSSVSEGAVFINAKLAVALNPSSCTHGFASSVCKGITLQLKVSGYKSFFLTDLMWTFK